jgi:hypothetical protein
MLTLPSRAPAGRIRRRHRWKSILLRFGASQPRSPLLPGDASGTAPDCFAVSTAPGTRYRSDSQLYKSSSLQRALQKGRYGLPFHLVSRLQTGQRMAVTQPRRTRRLDLHQ